MNETLTVTLPEGLESVLKDIEVSPEDFPVEVTRTIEESNLDFILNKFGVSSEEYDKDSLVHIGNIFFYGRKYYIHSKWDNEAINTYTMKGVILVYLLAHIGEPVEREKLIEVSRVGRNTIIKYFVELEKQFINSVFKFDYPRGGKSVTLDYKS